MPKGRFARSLPGWFATFLAAVTTAVMNYGGFAGLFYEGWGQPFPTPLVHLAPGLASLAICLAALRWPRAGGLLLLAAGVGGGALWLNMQAARAELSVEVLLTLLIFFGPVLVTGGLFLLEARHQRLLREEGVRPSPRWIARNYRYLLVAVVPLVTVAILSAEWLPRLLSRRDDGIRGARVIKGNGVTLVWAPRGPGWNWKQPDGRYPSWEMITFYGVPPVGMAGKNRHGARPEEMARTCLCAYLNEDATALLVEPVFIWRMPTTDEIVRSLTRNGENAGCVWDGQSEYADCRTPPDKETPLWAPDEAPIYYWAAGERDPMNAYCVNYTGGTNYQPKSAVGLGFRCVKEVPRSSEGR